MRRSVMLVAAALLLATGSPGRAAVEIGYDLEGLAVVRPFDTANPAVQVNYSVDNSSRAGASPLPGFPNYTWWYGCSPTAGGMLLGYWDGKPGYGNLFEGDASSWWGEEDPSLGITGTKSMVAGTAHIVAGMENGYTYGDWHNSPSYPDHENNPDSLADFMRTVDGGTELGWIAQGLEDFVGWDNPATATNESGPAPGLYFDASVGLENIASYGGSFDYDDFKAEIDADRPVLLTVTTWHWSVGPALHNVVGYGYRDDMFTLSWPLGVSPPPKVTVGGFAVMDTWDDGIIGSEWVGPGPAYVTVEPVIDADGVEWWPFLGFGGASFIGYWDWMVYQGITIDIAVVPEPASILIWLLLGGLGLLAGWRRRRKAAVQ